ncbi:MAG: hypothetical protein AAGJ35_04075 [Myxococcota bacterium]
MKFQLNVTMKPVESIRYGEYGEIAKQLWSRLAEAGFHKPFSHYTVNYKVRTKSIEKFDVSWSRDWNLVYCNARKKEQATRELELSWRGDIEFRAIWSNEDTNSLFDQVEELISFLECNYKDTFWFLFSGLRYLGNKVHPRPRPPRWHRWLGGSIVWNAFDMRLPGIAEELIQLSLPAGVTMREQGHLRFVRWSSELTLPTMLSAIGERERFLAHHFEWAIESGYNAYGDRMTQTGHLVRLKSSNSYVTRHLRPHDEITFYQESSESGVQAVAFDLEQTSLKESVAGPIGWLESGSLLNGKPLSKLSFVVQSREHAVFAREHLSSEQAEFIFYPSSTGAHWFDPFPSGSWLDP